MMGVKGLSFHRRNFGHKRMAVFMSTGVRRGSRASCISVRACEKDLAKIPIFSNKKEERNEKGGVMRNKNFLGSCQLLKTEGFCNY
jgi:hypothetical protein